VEIRYKANAVFANNGLVQSGEAHEPCQDVIRGLGMLDAKGHLTVVVCAREDSGWEDGWRPGTQVVPMGSLELEMDQASSAIADLITMSL